MKFEEENYLKSFTENHDFEYKFDGNGNSALYSKYLNVI
jgi:hypothetical protein